MQAFAIVERPHESGPGALVTRYVPVGAVWETGRGNFVLNIDSIPAAWLGQLPDRPAILLKPVESTPPVGQVEGMSGEIPF